MSRVIPDPVQEPTISVAQAARILGVCPHTVYDALDRGEIPHIRLGTRKGTRVLTGKFLAVYGLEYVPTAPDTGSAAA